MKKDSTKKLRTGYTTGACAAAAAKAAVITLITKTKLASSSIYIPAGEFVSFPIDFYEITETEVTAGIRKDGGDDPDATHEALIKATVTWAKIDEIGIDGGEGVGRITKPGLPVPIGEAAINPVPRKMIKEAVEESLQHYGKSPIGIKVIISVPNGEQIALKTLNGRLGIVGGISILGTRGIVVPFSNEAYKESIFQALKVAKATKCEQVVVTTGGRSEKYAMKQYPTLPEEAFIEMGDFVGFTLEKCQELKIKKVSMVGMIGKFSKVAEGIMMVHARNKSINFQFLAKVAEEVGVKGRLLEQVRRANTASQIAEMMLENNFDSFFELICKYCCKSATKITGNGVEIETSLYTLNGQLLGKAGSYESNNETDWNRS